MFTQQRASTSMAPIGPLAQLPIRIQNFAVINDATENGKDRQTSLLKEAEASCLFIMSEVLNHGSRDPEHCWFPV